MSEKTTSYYDQTSAHYDELHGGDKDREHIRALELGWPILERLGIKSVAEVGCGTGRSMGWLGERDKSLDLVGIDPSAGLLEIARKRLPHARFERGHGERLPLADRSVDLVIASGIMHHVDSPAEVIQEMFRVTRKGILISDHNNFAFGGTLARRLRLWLYASGLLGPATFAKQGFKKQGYSEEDGWWYPYSLLNNYNLIASLSREQYIIPTNRTNSRMGNLLLSQSHLSIVAVKARNEVAGSVDNQDCTRI